MRSSREESKKEQVTTTQLFPIYTDMYVQFGNRFASKINSIGQSVIFTNALRRLKYMHDTAAFYMVVEMSYSKVIRKPSFNTVNTFHKNHPQDLFQNM